MFYLLIIQNAGYENPTQAVFCYNTLDEALAAFHSELAYRGEARHLTTCVIVDAHGLEVKRDSWEKHEEVEMPES